MKEKHKRSKWGTVFVKFAVMLSVGIVAIGGMLISGKHRLQAENQAAELTLHKKKDVDNAAFCVSNMFPGDAVEGYYCVKVSYEEEVTVYFRADIGEESDRLAEVLKCRVELLDTGEMMYDGLMKDVPDALGYALPYAEKGEEELLYQITAYLDTSVGNEYQNTSLQADFVWWLETETDTDDEEMDQTPSEPDDEGKDTVSPDGGVDEKDTVTVGTGDNINTMMWFASAVCAAAVLITVSITWKRKEGNVDEQ